MAAETDNQIVTQLLSQVGEDESSASEKLLPIVYQELRSLAEQLMACEPLGLTLQPTALVHEAYLRLVGDTHVHWNGRGHFFGAAARAMRRILIERARRVGQQKRGGDRQRVDLSLAEPGVDSDVIDVIALDEALTRLEAIDQRKSDIISLRYFAGLTIKETARSLGISEKTVKNEWRYARAWLYRELIDDDHS